MTAFIIRNNTGSALNVILEPWAEVVSAKPGQIVRVDGLKHDPAISKHGAYEVVVHNDQDGPGLALYVNEEATIHLID